MEGMFDLLENRTLTDSICFLCGISLDESSISREHVFPLWLQHQCGLLDQRLTLLNRTLIPYRDLVIPCCKECNSEHLSGLESRVRSGLFSDDFRSHPSLYDDLSLWTIKIFFGILFKEVQLLLDRRDPEKGPIVPDALLREFRTLHAFLQRLRLPLDIVGLNGMFPISLFVFEVKADPAHQDAFDFRDGLYTSCLYMRIGARGIVACFDGGAQADRGKEYLAKLAQVCLHPIQLAEFAAKVFYMATLFTRVPLYSTVQTDGRYYMTMVGLDSADCKGVVHYVGLDEDRLVAIPDIPEIDDPVFSDWSQQDYAKVLAEFLGRPAEDLNPKDDLVYTYLWNEDGSFKDIPLELPPANQ